MTTPHPKLTDALLKDVLTGRSAGVHTSTELLSGVLEVVETTPQGHTWERRLAVRGRLLPVFISAALLVGLLGVAIVAGGHDSTPPAGRGLIAYESGGDIFVGDAATGETRAIVTGPAVEGSPVFSPDGTQIAFYRSPTGPVEAGGSAWPTSASIVVVRVDGSDERVVVPAGVPGRLDLFPGRALGAFAWTPDGASLIVAHDVGRGPTGGLVSLFDAARIAEPRLLTPPLPRWPGGIHPQVRGEVAPMFRPPIGDRILSYPDPGPPTGGLSTLVEMDLDGSNPMQIIDPVRTDPPFEIIYGAIWSADGRWIAVTAADRCSQTDPYGCYGWEPNQRVYVVSADGSQVRRLTSAPADVDPGQHTIERAIGWSPDGSRILIDRTTAEDLDVGALATKTFPIDGQTLVVDVATGAERAITGATSGTYGPPYGEVPGGNGIDWVPSSISSWSPDGKSVLVWDGPGTQPLVIDVATGASTRLPWATDAHPSWRLVGAAAQG